MNQNNKKLLAEQLKQKLNSPEYIAMPDLITFDDRCGDMSVWYSKNKKGWIGGTDINPEPTIYNSSKKEPSPHIVSYEGLEENDWEEIVNLIEKRNKEKEQIWETKKKNIEQKLNQQSNLYYYWEEGSKKNRADVWNSNKGRRGYTTFLGGNGNGLTHHLYIAENHSVLDNFPFQTGFYYVDNNKTFKKDIGNYEGGFRNSGGETNPFNWKKYVEVSDQITITPYEVENDSELVENQKKDFDFIKNCDICQKDRNSEEKWYSIKRYHGQKSKTIHACSNCYKNKEQDYLQNYEFIFSFPADDGNLLETVKGGKTDCYAGHKDQNGNILQQQNCPHCQPWKNHKTDNKTGKLSDKVEKEIIEWLIQYFQTNNIKHISLKNGELTITNNNKLITSEQVNNDTELKNIQNLLQSKGIQDLDRQDLNITNSPTSPNSQKPDYTPYLLTGAIGIGLVSLVVASYYLGKKRSKKTSY